MRRLFDVQLRLVGSIVCFFAFELRFLSCLAVRVRSQRALLLDNLFWRHKSQFAGLMAVIWIDGMKIYRYTYDIITAWLIITNSLYSQYASTATFHLSSSLIIRHLHVFFSILFWSITSCSSFRPHRRLVWKMPPPSPNKQHKFSPAMDIGKKLQIFSLLSFALAPFNLRGETTGWRDE